MAQGAPLDPVESEPSRDAPAPRPSSDQVPFFDGEISSTAELLLIQLYGVPLDERLRAEVDTRLGTDFEAKVAKNVQASLPELRPAALEVVDLHTAKADRAVARACEAIAAAHAANDEPRALDLTVSAWDDFHADTMALRPRVFGAVADAVVPRILPDVARVDALFVEIRRATYSLAAEKLAREWLGAWVRARAGTIADAILAPGVDGALDAARNRQTIALGRCAPRATPKAAPKAAPKSSAKPTAGEGADEGVGDAPR